MDVFEDSTKGATRPPGSEVKTDPGQSRGTSDVLLDAGAGIVRTSSSTWSVHLNMSFRAENQALEIQTALKSSRAWTVVAAGAALDPDSVITRPDASALRRSDNTSMTPLPKSPAKDH
jgi:hypothetical protein